MAGGAIRDILERSIDELPDELRTVFVACAGLASGGSVGWLAALFGRRHEGHVHEWAESQILNGGIVLIVHPASAEQFEAATAIMRRHCGADVFASPSA